MILLTSILQSSCRKESITTTSDLDQFTTSCGTIPVGSQIIDLVADSIDLDNDKVFKILFHYAQAVRIMATDPIFGSIMTSAILADTTKLTASLHTIAANNSGFKEQLNLLLKQSIQNNNIYPVGADPQLNTLMNQPNWDADSYLFNILFYKGEQHTSNIIAVRKIAIGPPNNPVVGLGFDMNDCDEIPGWQGSTEIAISETMAKSLNNTVLIIGPGEILPIPSPNNLISNKVETADSKAKTKIDQRITMKIDITPWGFKNGSRFEKNGSSEVVGKFVFIDAPNNPLNYENDQSLHKNAFKNNSVFTNNWRMATFSWPGEGGKVVRFGVYEYDWFSSLKTVPNDGSYQPALNLDGRRTYINDYYHGNAAIIGASGLFSLFSWVGSTFVVNNNKCSMTYTRTQ